MLTQSTNRIGFAKTSRLPLALNWIDGEWIDSVKQSEASIRRVVCNCLVFGYYFELEPGMIVTSPVPFSEWGYAIMGFALGLPGYISWPIK
jgi:hypothetical protein